MHIYNTLNETSCEKQHGTVVQHTALAQAFHMVNEWKYCNCAECNSFFQEKTREKKRLAEERRQRATERLAEFSINERHDIAEVMSIIGAKSPVEQRKFLTNLKNLLAI